MVFNITNIDAIYYLKVDIPNGSYDIKFIPSKHHLLVYESLNSQNCYEYHLQGPYDKYLIS